MRGLVLLSLFSLAAPHGENFCPCEFISPEDPDCRVYGQLGDGHLIAWYKADQACLDEFQIKDRAVDLDVLERMCPNLNGTDGNVDAYVNYIRFTEGVVGDAMRAYLPQFFDPEDGLVSNYTTDAGVFLDCEANPSFCWNEIKFIVSTQPQILTEACSDLWVRQINSLNLEQSVLRVRLCQEDNATEACEPLFSQVKAGQAANPDSFCSAFGLGPAGAELPAKETCGLDPFSSPTGAPAGGGEGGTSSGSAVQIGRIGLLVFNVVMSVTFLV